MSASKSVASEVASGSSENPGISDLEVQVIDLFVRGVRVLGLPKSVGEIYGLLYISPEPLPLDTLVGRLQMSKGSTSQGLKFLRNLGAVKPVYVAGDRRDHYEVQTELKELVAGFMKGELVPHLDSGAQRLEQLDREVEADDSENAEFYRARIDKLSIWRSRGAEMMKLVEELLT
ncbi:MAG: GbsR/MarR family transcriptional regulator [Verrucomicrobiales bacterium]